MSDRPPPVIEYTIDGECLGCSARFGAPCDLLCSYRTGEFDVPDVLRRAAQHLPEHRAGIGYDLVAALAAAAHHLVGAGHAPRLAAQARQVLTGYLVERDGRRNPQVVRAALLRHGLHTPPDRLRTALFTAAREYDGLHIGLSDVAATTC
jgi:hypothetical protein